MKTNELNKINNTQAAEVAAKEAAEKAAKEKEILDAVQPGGVIDMINDINAGIASFVTDDNDNIVGFGYHPHAKGINAAKRVNSVLTVGATEEERQQDEMDAKIFVKRYGGMWEGKAIMEIAHSLINAGIMPDKEVKHNGVYYFLCADLKKVIDQSGNTIIDLSEDPIAAVGKELLLEALNDKLTIYLQEKEAETASRRSSYHEEEEEECDDGEPDCYALYLIDEDGDEDYYDSYDTYEEAEEEGDSHEDDDDCYGYVIYSEDKEGNQIDCEYRCEF